MKKIATYKNGNVLTTLYDDGTKIHFTEEDEFHFEFPESHDISISQCCDNGCEWCYYGCTPNGKHGELVDWKFFDTMRPYTEIAINLQLPINPQFEAFLTEMNNRHIIVNVTVNQNHFMNSNLRMRLHGWVDANLIKGIGISLVKPSKEFINDVKKFDNAVIHVIAGVTPIENIMALANNNLKLLILGYKAVGRGDKYLADNSFYVIDGIEDISENFDSILKGFKVVSFDNLAIKQLKVKDRLTDKEWKEFYGGDDGTLTFFIDLVKGVFAKNSLSQIVYPIGDKTIDEMFDVIRSEINNDNI